jgi:hypothetical protein
MPEQGRSLEQWVDQYRLEILTGKIKPKHDPRWMTDFQRLLGRNTCRHRWIAYAGGMGILIEHNLEYCEWCLLMGDWVQFMSSMSDPIFQQLFDPLEEGVPTPTRTSRHIRLRE